MAPYANPWCVPLLEHWNPPAQTQGRPLTLHIHRTLLSSAQVALLLCRDNVLYVLHGQVLAEGVIEKSLQLVHCQLLHVTLGWVAKGTSVLATTLPQAHPAQSQRQASRFHNTEAPTEFIPLEPRPPGSRTPSGQWSSPTHCGVGLTIHRPPHDTST